MEPPFARSCELKCAFNFCRVLIHGTEPLMLGSAGATLRILQVPPTLATEWHLGRVVDVVVADAVAIAMSSGAFIGTAMLSPIAPPTAPGSSIVHVGSLSSSRLEIAGGAGERDSLGRCRQDDQSERANSADNPMFQLHLSLLVLTSWL
jgi:hypothetical protein